VCLLLSVTLGVKSNQESASIVFAAVFVVIWCGAAAVTLNAQLLGGNISFFQSVCILGYVPVILLLFFFLSFLPSFLPSFLLFLFVVSLSVSLSIYYCLSACILRHHMARV
jgi:protein YIPF6